MNKIERVVWDEAVTIVWFCLHLLHQSRFGAHYTASSMPDWEKFVKKILKVPCGLGLGLPQKPLNPLIINWLRTWNGRIAFLRFFVTAWYSISYEFLNFFKKSCQNVSFLPFCQVSAILSVGMHILTIYNLYVRFYLQIIINMLDFSFKL